MIDNLAWGKRRQLTTAVINADQAEMAAILETIVAAGVGVLDERIAEAFEDELGKEINDPLKVQLERDQQLEQLTGEVLEEIGRRQHWLGPRYPFTLEGNALKYKKSKTGVYEYCLAISCAPSLVAQPYADLVRYFEVLVADSFRAFLGSGADFLRTGAPKITHAKSSTDFEQGISVLHQATQEWVWGPQPEALPDLPSVKDEGLDFVVWKRVDQRVGTLFLVGQCACGQTDWHEKDQDIDANFSKLRRWVSRLTFVPPVRAFAMPMPISASKVFATLTERAGLTMDRLRLTSIAEDESNCDHFVAHHTPQLQQYTDVVIKPA
ncbi:hypothetical protein HZS47_26620 [Achromobacter xylosoxidans]|uniref:hypothetical protein n=1 Tax=Alcaligenes xylosoxydans xylosoxydans TaxID=85698 RepID=UPI0015C7ADF8|nr:hypothetical protein [Achromobacter xylosoxidans]NYS16423.1 hypothetical protein [Achromobacter xylosoxidans]